MHYGVDAVKKEIVLCCRYLRAIGDVDVELLLPINNLDVSDVLTFFKKRKLLTLDMS